MFCVFSMSRREKKIKKTKTYVVYCNGSSCLFYRNDYFRNELHVLHSDKTGFGIKKYDSVTCTWLPCKMLCL